MTRRPPFRRITPRHSTWLRLVALACVMLVAIGASAQAAHIHGQWLPQPAIQASLPADASQGQGEEHCSLCVAMHTALPVTLQFSAEQAPPILQFAAPVAARPPDGFWTFASFSRPPPAA